MPATRARETVLTSTPYSLACCEPAASRPGSSAEWKVRADAASAQKFAASGAEITYAGLDITTFVKLDADLRWETKNQRLR